MGSSRVGFTDKGGHLSPGTAKRFDALLDLGSAAAQVEDARAFLADIRSGAGLFMPWPDLAGLVGRLLPGWFVVVGGRATGGKTTMLLNLLSAWVEYGKRVVYVGTEQPASVLRIVWAAQRLGVPVDRLMGETIGPGLAQRLEQDLAAQREPDFAMQAQLIDAPNGSLGELEERIAFARAVKADVLVFDHLHRLDTGSGEAAWLSFAAAVREVKNMARDFGLLLIAGAQLKYGEGGPLLGAHEAPGDSSWYGGLKIQQEADVALQLWRPFRAGVSREDREAARASGNAKPLVQENVMAVRVAKHRYRNQSMNEVRRLVVRDGRLESFTGRSGRAE